MLIKQNIVKKHIYVIVIDELSENGLFDTVV
jgi:hypothetical protein